jgi:hypothetical protein
MMPRNALPLTAIALCVALLVWQFVPVPLGVDPDNWGRFIGILLLYAALFSLGLIGMATALRGQRDFLSPARVALHPSNSVASVFSSSRCRLDCPVCAIIARLRCCGH